MDACAARATFEQARPWPEEKVRITCPWLVDVDEDAADASLHGERG